MPPAIGSIIDYYSQPFWNTISSENLESNIYNHTHETTSYANEIFFLQWKMSYAQFNVFIHSYEA